MGTSGHPRCCGPGAKVCTFASAGLGRADRFDELVIGAVVLRSSPRLYRVKVNPSTNAPGTDTPPVWRLP